MNRLVLRLVLSYALAKGWRVRMFDVSTAFLRSLPMEKEIYLSSPRDRLFGDAAGGCDGDRGSEPISVRFRSGQHGDSCLPGVASACLRAQKVVYVR